MKTINDEALSAFLDGELPEREAAELRAALAHDRALGERLDELAAVDRLVGKQARALDGRAMPEEVLRLLRETDGEAPGKVVRRDFRGRLDGLRDFGRRHAALAAGLALVLGFAAGRFIGGGPPGAALAEPSRYAATLNRMPSGESVAVGGAATLSTRFSFQDPEGRWCRLYRLRSSGYSSENLACRDGGDWTLVAGVLLPEGQASEGYRPASGSPGMDALLEGMMPDRALSLEEEAALLVP